MTQQVKLAPSPQSRVQECNCLFGTRGGQVIALESQDLLQNGRASEPARKSREVPRPGKQLQGRPLWGTPEAAVSDSRVGLSSQLMFHWDRNAATEDLVTDLVGLNLAWRGGTGCGMGEWGEGQPPPAADALYYSLFRALCGGSSCHLHAAPPFATG